MKLALKWGLKVIAGVLGLATLISMVFLGWIALDAGQNPILLSLLFFQAAIELYVIFVAYLVWFRFSPRALKHLSAVLTIAVFLYSLDMLRERFGGESAFENPWYGFSMVSGLSIGFWAWVFLAGFFNRILFPAAPATHLASGSTDNQPPSAIGHNEAARP